MTHSGYVITYIIAAFGFALLIILRKNSMPESLRRPLAIVSLFLIISAFILMIISFFGY